MDMNDHNVHVISIPQKEYMKIFVVKDIGISNYILFSMLLNDV